jgi:hypothetical protein
MVAMARHDVLALSPDAASTAAAQRLALSARWTSLGTAEECLWGRCQGSGRTPYQTVVRLGSPLQHGCTCPSRKTPCKHVLALLLLDSGGAVPTLPVAADFAAAWLRAQATHGTRSARPTADAPVADPEAAAKRAAARVERVAAGLDDLDRWLQDQVRGGLAGVERAGYAHFDRVAARMVDAQAPGVASMLRSIPAELAADGWPERVLERLGALRLLIRAHRRLDDLPSELAANVRSRVGYPVSRASVLSGSGVEDQWLVLGLVDAVEAQLETRRVWLYGTRSRRWALNLSFAVPGQQLDSTVLPGQRRSAELHFYPGSGFRGIVAPLDEPAALGEPGSLAEPAALDGAPVAETCAGAQRRFASLLSVDPWATRMPALLAVAPIPPERGLPWRLRDVDGGARPAFGSGELWPLLARSCGEPILVFGEWENGGFRPLSVLADGHGSPFSTAVAA